MWVTHLPNCKASRIYNILCMVKWFIYINYESPRNKFFSGIRWPKENWVLAGFQACRGRHICWHNQAPSHSWPHPRPLTRMPAGLWRSKLTCPHFSNTQLLLTLQMELKARAGHHAKNTRQRPCQVTVVFTPSQSPMYEFTAMITTWIFRLSRHTLFTFMQQS